MSLLAIPPHHYSLSGFDLLHPLVAALPQDARQHAILVRLDEAAGVFYLLEDLLPFLNHAVCQPLHVV